MTAFAALALPHFQKEKGSLSSDTLCINRIKLSSIRLTKYSVSTPLRTLLPPEIGDIVNYTLQFPSRSVTKNSYIVHLAP